MYISATASMTARTERRPPLQRLRVERLPVVPGRLGHLHVHGARGRVDALWLGAIGITPALRRALVMPAPRKRSRSICIANSNARANTPARSPGPCSISCSKIASTAVIFPSVHSLFSMVGLQLHGIPRMGSPCWGAPQQGLMAPNSSEFPDVRLQYPPEANPDAPQARLRPSIAANHHAPWHDGKCHRERRGRERVAGRRDQPARCAHEHAERQTR